MRTRVACWLVGWLINNIDTNYSTMGKKKKGDKKDGGATALPPPPDFSINRQGALEAMLTYKYFWVGLSGANVRWSTLLGCCSKLKHSICAELKLNLLFHKSTEPF